MKILAKYYTRSSLILKYSMVVSSPATPGPTATSQSCLPWPPPGAPSVADATYPRRGSRPRRSELLRPPSHATARVARRSPSSRRWVASREAGGVATCLEPHRRGGLAAGFERCLPHPSASLTAAWSEKNGRKGNGTV